MTITFAFFHDSALTQQIDASNKLTATQDAAGGLGPVDKIIYFGSTNSANKVQVVADPGITPITVIVSDADAGTGAPAIEVKLALSSGGLDSAVAGAALELSHTINGGVLNAVPIHVRRTSALATTGVYTDITLAAQELQESAI